MFHYMPFIIGNLNFDRQYADISHTMILNLILHQCIKNIFDKAFYAELPIYFKLKKQQKKETSQKRRNPRTYSM